MHPKRGEVSRRAQIPQNENRIAIETMSLLSVDLLCNRSLSTNPKSPPKRNIARFINKGLRTDSIENELSALVVESEMATENAIKKCIDEITFSS